MYKHFLRNEICQVVFSKMSLDPIHDERKDFKRKMKRS